MFVACAIQIVILPHAEDLGLPVFSTKGSSGMDLQAAITDPVILQPGDRTLIPTGISTRMGEGMEGQVRSRSGLALHHGVVCLNSPGTIDSDYEGEIGVILINHGKEPFTVNRGMKIAQLVFATCALPKVISTFCLNKNGEAVPCPNTVTDENPRGVGGFGSTGY